MNMSAGINSFNNSFNRMTGPQSSRSLVKLNQGLQVNSLNVSGTIRNSAKMGMGMSSTPNKLSDPFSDKKLGLKAWQSNEKSPFP